jgi:hypothetical protein
VLGLNALFAFGIVRTINNGHLLPLFAFLGASSTFFIDTTQGHRASFFVDKEKICGKVGYRMKFKITKIDLWLLTIIGLLFIIQSIFHIQTLNLAFLLFLLLILVLCIIEII